MKLLLQPPRVLIFIRTRNEAEKSGEKQIRLVEALVRCEEELGDENERVMQATNIAQPIQYAVCLPGRRLCTLTGLKVDRSKGIIAIRIQRQELMSAIILGNLRAQTEEVCLLGLPVLKPVGLILDRVHLNLNRLPVGLASQNKEFLFRDSRLFDYSFLPML